GAGWVELPNALTRKYLNAGRDWGWQWVFPATRFYLDRLTGQRRRHHLHESVLQRAVKDAVRGAGIAKQATCHTFRHSFDTAPPSASHPLAGSNPRPPHRPAAARRPTRRHHNALPPCSQPRPRRGPNPRRPDVPVMTSAAGNIGMAAVVPVIACSASRHITAR